MNMEYNFSEDLKSIREILGFSQSELAEKIGVEQVTISRTELKKTEPSARLLEAVYSFAFDKNIKINKLKEMFWRDDLGANEKLLFHGAKTEIDGEIDIHKGRKNNDFGQGFYTGESYKQAISFVSGFGNSSVYYIRFDDRDLKCKRYEVNQEWMMTIAYYRGTSDEYKDHPAVKALIEQSRNCDYIIAPIADNRMFQIINSFIAGDLTDEQCKHCLAATNLGMQYIFLTEKAVSQIKLTERCYISNNEREYYKNIRLEKSIDKMESSSEIFIRRFMRSRIAKRLDDGSVLESNIQAEDILQLVNEEYGFSNYGSVKYTRNEMYWIGYIYRYFVITYELTSMQVYKIVKPKELKGLFLPYHTMDPSQAIERILEAKGLFTDEKMELERQYEIFKRIRNKKI